MCFFLKSVIGLLFFLLVPCVLFSQQYTRRQLSGLYAGHSGGIPMKWYGNMEVMGTPPTDYHKLYIRPWGRFVFKEKHDRTTYKRRFLFIKGRSKKWGSYRGAWHVKGDSLYLKYSKRHALKKAYHIEFYDKYEVWGFWKIYKYRLTDGELSLMKIWKGDEQ